MLKKLFILVTFAVLGLLVGTGVYFWKQFNQPTINTQAVLVSIPMGSGPLAVGKVLQKKGVIQNVRTFQWYARLMGKSSALKAGHFDIPPQIPLKELLAILTGGRAASKKVTIPEGRASWEIFAILQNHYPHLDSATWNAHIFDSTLIQELEVPAKSLEGWLYPDTYHLPLAATEKELIVMLVKSMKRNLATLDNGPQSEFSNLGGWTQTLTLASIVEEETGKGTERARVAGVFHNRLRERMPLGADPTVRFIFRNLTGPIYKSQLASDNPYNTRRFPGLPPGPISNPGRKAIEAALYPQKSNELYFVAKDDGSGEHFFAPNLKMHNEYKAQAAKNRGE